MRKLVYGLGVNDAGYSVNAIINGRVVRCPFYVRWCNMLKRCYSKAHQDKYPTYRGCSVAAEWLIFSNFKSWMHNQGWRGGELDKDLLQKGNKIYSKECCVFISQSLNAFIMDRNDANGHNFCGVDFYRKNSMFRASLRNNLTGKREFLGFFNDEQSAHGAWLKRKHELALQLADLQTDLRVAAALRLRYAP